ncbi:MAG TPA: pantoate--beta-alanine ligase [Actinobacteria bacterium]|nr:pantoate--beta-alanine ligase [Actinomycetota bacterium]
MHGADELRGLPRRDRAVVMTMGALHDGHAELVREARRLVGDAGDVVITVFVNPTQFGAGEDFDAYPRTLEADVLVASQAGADVVFAPSAVEVYGPARGFRPDSVTIDPGPLGDILEGASRPGHFRGVLTVVNKLMSLTQPRLALFGEKDYQQLTLIRRMAADLSLPVDVIGVPTVREPDGLAMSSRNRYLSAHEREIAATIPRALDAAEAAAVDGPRAAEAAGRAVIASAPEVTLDYLVATDVDLGPAPEQGSGRLLVAATVGTTRLLDNRSARMGA